MLSAWGQAVLVLRWFIDGTRMRDLVRNNEISTSTGYKDLHEGIDVLVAQAPDLASALETVKGAGWRQVNLDGTVMATDRCRRPAPAPRMMLVARCVAQRSQVSIRHLLSCAKARSLILRS